MKRESVRIAIMQEMEARRFHDEEWAYVCDMPDETDQKEAGYIGCMTIHYQKDGEFENRWFGDLIETGTLGLFDELYNVMDVLRHSSHRNLWEPGEARLSKQETMQRFQGRINPGFTVRADYRQHTYLMRYADIPCDRDVIIYCYDRKKLDAHIQARKEKREKDAVKGAAQNHAGKTQPAKITPARARKREGNISWDEYFMGVASLSAMRSKDPDTQVGCCIVGPRNRIASVGYNGFPFGCDDDEYPWDRRRENLAESETKYPYVVHSELNAILNYRGESLDGAKMYVTMFPCCECAKAIIQSGIREVIYRDDTYLHSESGISASRMFKSAGVSVRQLKKNEQITVWI